MKEIIYAAVETKVISNKVQLMLIKKLVLNKGKYVFNKKNSIHFYFIILY